MKAKRHVRKARRWALELHRRGFDVYISCPHHELPQFYRCNATPPCSGIYFNANREVKGVGNLYVDRDTSTWTVSLYLLRPNEEGDYIESVPVRSLDHINLLVVRANLLGTIL
jgi:hypothetical protein